MIHQGQCLTLCFKAGNHLPRIHPRLDDLERHTPFNRLVLLGQVDHAHAAFADRLHQFVGTDLGPNEFPWRRADGSRRDHLDSLTDRRVDAFLVQQTIGLVVDLEQRVDAPSQIQVVAAGLTEERPRSRGSVFSTAARKISRADGDGWDMDNSLVLFDSKDQCVKNRRGVSIRRAELSQLSVSDRSPWSASRRQARA